MVVVAEGARADAALTVGFGVATSSLGIAVERAGRCAGTVGCAAALADTISPPVALKSAAVAVKLAARFATSVVVVPVIKRAAPGVVPVVVISYGSVMPV